LGLAAPFGAPLEARGKHGKRAQGGGRTGARGKKTASSTLPLGMIASSNARIRGLAKERHEIRRGNTLHSGGIMAIAVGQAAPDFTLKDQSQKDVKLSDFRGKNVVIVFYPLDWSPVCTNEHACFVNDMKQFEKLNAQVLGLSVDSVWSHKAFADKMGIHYPLLADFQPRGAVAEKFGVYLADKGITGRAIAIVDKTGKIAWMKNYDIPTVPDINEVSRALANVQ
jgi:peroxiredoxin